MTKEFLHKLDDEGIEYVVWKSIEDADLLEQDESVELDLYMEEKHAGKLRELAIEHGFSHRSTTVERYTDFFYIIDNNRLVMLHIMYKIITGAKLKNFYLPIGDDLLATRVRQSGVWVSDPKPVLCYHALKYVLLDADKHWNAISKSTPEEILYVQSKMDEALGPNVLNVEAIVSSGRDQNQRVSWRRRLILKTLSPYLRYSAIHTLDRIGTRLRWIFGRRGFTIAFVGVDGSGKSTLSKEINRRLGFLGSKSLYYMGPKKTYPRPLRLFIRLGTLAKTIIRSNIGVVSVYDRYLYDVLTYRTLPTTLSGLLYKTIPTPDFTFYCNAPLNDIIARKHHDDPKKLGAISHNYAKLLTEKPNAHFLDTTRAPSITVAEIMKILTPRIQRSLI
ncbi:MAG: hypothetical protein AAF438_15025 [Pseudomonadota bacterium]